MGKSVWDFIAPIAGAALGSVVPGVGTALGASIGSGLGTGIRTGNPLSGALAAGGSYLGGEALGGLGGTLGSTPAGALGAAGAGETLGASAPFGSFAGNVLGSQTLGSMAGQAVGSKIGENVGSQLNPMSPDMGGPSGPAPFMASRSPQMGLPQSLSQFASLDPNQQASNIATRGVYGQGNGPQENQYFTNLINRQLVDDQGNVANDNSSISPVEGSYLNQIGLGGYQNPNQLLQKIQGYAG